MGRHDEEYVARKMAEARKAERQRIRKAVEQAEADAVWEHRHAAIDKPHKAQAFGAMVAYGQVIAIIEGSEE
jgi:hypothetical protein